MFRAGLKSADDSTLAAALQEQQLQQQPHPEGAASVPAEALGEGAEIPGATSGFRTTPAAASSFAVSAGHSWSRGLNARPSGSRGFFGGAQGSASALSASRQRSFPSSASDTDEGRRRVGDFKEEVAATGTGGAVGLASVASLSRRRSEKSPRVEDASQNNGLETTRLDDRFRRSNIQERGGEA